MRTRLWLSWLWLGLPRLLVLLLVLVLVLLLVLVFVLVLVFLLVFLLVLVLLLLLLLRVLGRKPCPVTAGRRRSSVAGETGSTQLVHVLWRLCPGILWAAVRLISTERQPHRESRDASRMSALSQSTLCNSGPD